MIDLQKHYTGVIRCFMYAAAPGGATPLVIPTGNELVELLTGGEVLFTDDNGDTRRYGSGTIFWHRPGEETVCRAVPENPYRCLAIRLRIGDELPCPAPRIGRWVAAANMNLFVADVLNIFRRRNGEDTGFLAVYTAATLLRQTVFSPEPELPASLRKACHLIDADPTGKPDLERLAAACGISKSHLFALFRKFLGSSPCRYLLERRMEMAKNLLMQPDLPIKSIAESCGFNDIEVFYRHFRKLERTTPGNYRADNLSR